MPEPQPPAHFVCKYSEELPRVIVCNRCSTQGEALVLLKEHVRLARQTGWVVRQERGLPVLIFKRPGEEFVMFIDTLLAAHMRLN